MLVSAAMKSVRASSSPQARLCGLSGSRRVPRCSPLGESSQMPDGPHTYTLPAVSTLSPSMASSPSAPVMSKNSSPPVTVERVAHNDLAIRVPVADVEVAFVRGQRDAIRPGQFRGDERDRAVADPEDAAERQFLFRVAEQAGEAERRVGEVQGPVPGVH